MNILLVVASVVAIVTSIIFSKNQKTESDVLSVTSEPTLSPEVVESPSATLSPTPLPSYNPTALPVADNSTFVYPGSTVVSKTDSHLSLVSGEDTAKITSWYEEKIKSLGFSAKAFVKTSSNDNVLNKLSGAREGEKITVEITSSQADSQTKIEIDLDKN